MWLVCTILVMFFCGVVEVLEKKWSGDEPLNFWIWGNLIYGLYSIIIGLLLYSSIIHEFNINTLLLTFPISFLSTIGYICSVKSLKYASISSVSPILNSKVIVVLLLSTIFFKDYLSVLQIILIFLLLILIILLNYKKDKTQKTLKKRYNICNIILYI